jgi:hypothetical protein
MNIICVGIIGSANGVSWDEVVREFYAVTRDIRLRVLFDPTAELVGGFSGGGENSFVFSRFHAQHVAGVFSMSGWLGRGDIYPTYQTTDRVQTNLLVARTTGLSDTGRFWALTPDSNYLASCGAVIQDWWFSGGHSVPPDSVKSNCLAWLLSQRIPAGPNDQSNALMLATNWQARITAGQQESVLRECVSNLMLYPRSWFAYQAQLTLDQLLTNYTAFRSLDVSNLAQGDFTSDLFFYYAYGAATNNDRQRYYAALKALTGVTGTCGDRAGDIYSLLQKYGYSAPALQCSADQIPGQMNLWFTEDTPGLAYSLNSRTNLVTDAWQNVSPPATDTNGVWSAMFGLDPGSGMGFYRAATVPTNATSPPWPPP